LERETDKLLELFDLVISPECQRQGVGRLLLEEGLREIDEMGLQWVGLV